MTFDNMMVGQIDENQTKLRDHHPMDYIELLVVKKMNDQLGVYLNLRRKQEKKEEKKKKRRE